MKIIMKLIKYHFSLFIKSTKFVMPLLVWIGYMAFTYTIFPVDVVSSIVVSSVLLFFLMVWIGVLYYEIEDTISEQILVLKTQNETICYISNIIFLGMIGFVFSCIGIIFPLLQNAMNGFELYRRPITLWDIVVALGLHFFAALLGGMLGGVFHPRIMKNRKMAIVIVALIALLSITKVSINQEIPILRYVTWILPPVGDYSLLMTNKEYFEKIDVGISMLLLFVYNVVLMVSQIVLLKKRKF